MTALVKSKRENGAMSDLDRALGEQRHLLFQAMGIVALATEAIRDSADPSDITNAWTALDAAHGLLRGVAGRLETSKTLLGRVSEG